MNKSPELTIKIKIKPERMALIDEQVELCGLESRTQLFNEMAQFFLASLEGIKKGAQPGLYYPEQDKIEILTTSGLKTAINAYLKEQYGSNSPKAKHPQLSLVVDNTFEVE